MESAPANSRRKRRNAAAFSAAEAESAPAVLSVAETVRVRDFLLEAGIPVNAPRIQADSEAAFGMVRALVRYRAKLLHKKPEGV